MRRLWTMLAHRQGAPLNLAELARSLGLDGRTVGHLLDVLVDLLLVRRLAPVHSNVPDRGFLVGDLTDPFPVADTVTAVGVSDLLRHVRDRAQS